MFLTLVFFGYYFETLNNFIHRIHWNTFKSFYKKKLLQQAIFLIIKFTQKSQNCKSRVFVSLFSQSELLKQKQQNT